MLGLLPYDCAAIFFGTTIGSLEQFDALTKNALVLTVSIAGLSLALGTTVLIGCLARRKLHELTAAAAAAQARAAEEEQVFGRTGDVLP